MDDDRPRGGHNQALDMGMNMGILQMLTNGARRGHRHGPRGATTFWQRAQQLALFMLLPALIRYFTLFP